MLLLLFIINILITFITKKYEIIKSIHYGEQDTFNLSGK